MSPRICPKCGLVNFATSERCDCGTSLTWDAYPDDIHFLFYGTAANWAEYQAAVDAMVLINLNTANTALLTTITILNQ